MSDGMRREVILIAAEDALRDGFIADDIPAEERYRDLAERVVGDLADAYVRAVSRITELETDLERERLARRMVDQALRDDRAERGGQ